MNPSDSIGCLTFPCTGVNQSAYRLPQIDLDPERVRMVVISEASPENAADDYYASGEPLFQQTTLQAFEDAGLAADSFRELLERGIYFTNAVKCGKLGYNLKAGPIQECSRILEAELALFPKARVWMLMGDVAIQAVNAIARRAGAGRAIPAGSTYKIRGCEFAFAGRRLFPSYLQAGPSFFIEKSKRKAIAEDLRAAWNNLQA